MLDRTRIYMIVIIIAYHFLFYFFYHRSLIAARTAEYDGGDVTLLLSLLLEVRTSVSSNRYLY